MPMHPPLRRRSIARLLTLSAAAGSALGACGDGARLDPDQPFAVVTPNPAVLVVEDPPRLVEVSLQRGLQLRALGIWMNNAAVGSPGVVTSDGRVWAALPGRDTMVVGVSTVDGPDSNFRIPFIARGLRRPSGFPAYRDTVRLWLTLTGQARVTGFSDPLVEDTVAVPQDVRWSVEDPTLVSVEAVAGDTSQRPGVRLIPRRPGRTTLTVQSAAVANFRLQRPLVVGTCARFGRYGDFCSEVVPNP